MALSPFNVKSRECITDIATFLLAQPYASDLEGWLLAEVHLQLSYGINARGWSDRGIGQAQKALETLEMPLESCLHRDRPDGDVDPRVQSRADDLKAEIKLWLEFCQHDLARFGPGTAELPLP
jgi:hypothetical protein